MKILNYLPVLLSLCLSACSPNLQTSTTAPTALINQVTTDKKGNKHLLGLSNRQGLQTAPFVTWFDKYYEAYQPHQKVLDKNKANLKNIRIVTFMGTWCGDSKREVPRFYKVIDELGLKDKQLSLVNLDRASENYKQSPTGEEKGLNIHRVPTFVVYRGEEEIGRIVESPVTSMETDLVQILNGLATRPNYRVVDRVHLAFQNKEFENLEEDKKKWGNFVRRNAKSASELNTYGYVLFAADKTEEAITVFQLNTYGFPQEANTYDSLGEAYHKSGQIDLAMVQYEKVLSLEPENEHAKEVLEELKMLN